MASSCRERKCRWRAVGNAISKLLERINGFDSWDWTDGEVVQTHGTDTRETTVWTIWVKQRYDELSLTISFWMIFMNGIIDFDFSIMFIWWSLYNYVFFIHYYTYVWFIHYVPAIIPIVRFQRKRKHFLLPINVQNYHILRVNLSLNLKTVRLFKWRNCRP